jgi:hypothetical protein
VGTFEKIRARFCQLKFLQIRKLHLCSEADEPVLPPLPTSAAFREDPHGPALGLKGTAFPEESCPPAQPPLRASLTALPAVNLAALDAAIVIGAPV